MMIFKLRIGHWDFTTTITQFTKVIGVNSTLPDGNHILMWDFDEQELSDVCVALKEAQAEYKLPSIIVLNTGAPNHFIAYCFVRMPWIQTVGIVASTPYVDYNFFKYAVLRKRWTLRISDKEGRNIKRAAILIGFKHPNVYLKDLHSFVRYETMTSKSPKGWIQIGKRRNT